MTEPQLEIEKQVDRLEKVIRKLLQPLPNKLRQQLEDILDGKEEAPDATS